MLTFQVSNLTIFFSKLPSKWHRKHTSNIKLVNIMELQNFNCYNFHKDNPKNPRFSKQFSIILLSGKKRSRTQKPKNEPRSYKEMNNQQTLICSPDFNLLARMSFRRASTIFSAVLGPKSDTSNACSMQSPASKQL